MPLECPGCKSVLDVGPEMSGTTVRCAKCSATIQVPAAEGVTVAPTPLPAASADTFANRDVAEKVAPATRTRDWGDDDYRERRPRPQQASSGLGTLSVILLFGLGLPFLLVVVCAGLGFVFSFMAHREIVHDEVMMAQMPEVAVEVGPDFPFRDEVVPEFDVPGIIDPNEPIVPIERPPAAAAVRLKDFINENLRPNNQAGPLAPNAPIWAKIAAADPKTLEASPLINGNWGNVNFRETGPDNGILVGFFASSSNNFLVDFVQPIYLTEKGETVGKAYGEARDRVVCIKAKETYAVGAIDVRSGDLFDGFQVKFMRVEGESLNVNDSYRAARVGGMGGEPLRVGNTGRFILGIHGRSLAQANITPAGSITSLGLLSLK